MQLEIFRTKYISGEKKHLFSLVFPPDPFNIRISFMLYYGLTFQSRRKHKQANLDFIYKNLSRNFYQGFEANVFSSQ